MRNKRTLVLIFLGSLVACSDDNPTNIDGRPPIDGAPGTPDAPAVTDVDVAADITADTTWTADKTYHLKKKPTAALPYIFVNPGMTLTIEPGTTILGGAGSAL